MSFDSFAFKSMYPEFEGIDNCAVVGIGTREDMIVSDSSWGELRQHALFLRVAHRLALRFNIGKIYKQKGLRDSASSGIVTSKSASNSSLSESSQLNAFVQSDNPIWADFGRTIYGLEYLSLLEENMAESQVVYSRRVIDVYR